MLTNEYLFKLLHEIKTTLVGSLWMFIILKLFVTFLSRSFCDAILSFRGKKITEQRESYVQGNAPNMEIKHLKYICKLCRKLTAVYE